jgi:hypothetical protein
MERHGLDALILFCRDNIRVASGFRTFDQLEMGGSIAEEYACIVDHYREAQVFQPWNEPVTGDVAERFRRIKNGPTYQPGFQKELLAIIGLRKSAKK